MKAKKAKKAKRKASRLKPLAAIMAAIERIEGGDESAWKDLEAAARNELQSTEVDMRALTLLTDLGGCAAVQVAERVIELYEETRIATGHADPEKEGPV